MKIALLGPYPVNLHAAAGPPPLPGGVEAVMLALASGLARRPGLEIRLITAVAGLQAPEQIVGDGFSVVCVPRPRGGRLTGQRQVVRNIRAQIAAFAPDIVHAHSAGIYARAAQVCGLPSVITLHGVIYREMQQAWPASSWPTRLRWLSDALFERVVVQQAQQIIAISPYIMAEFRGRTRARFHTVENPVDDRFFAVEAPPPGHERLLCVARVIPRKGIMTLVRAFGQLAKARPAATLVVIGETETAPAYAAQCRALAAELGLAERVTFTGALPPDAVAAHYAAADLVLLASEQETAPVTIAEAMAAGRAVVTTAVGGCADMVRDGVTGHVVPARDPEALAAAALALLAEPARLARLSQAARRAAEARFRLDAIVETTLAVYASILEGQP